MQENNIKTRFNSFTEQKQVIVYAEALRKEYYELLNIINTCIDSNKRAHFDNLVQEHLKTNYAE